jgi:hypothetical protein
MEVIKISSLNDFLASDSDLQVNVSQAFLALINP